MKCVKYCILYIIILCFFITSCAADSKNESGDHQHEQEAEPEIGQWELQGQVVLDAGHGGFDSGALGVETGVREDGLNLSVTNLLRNELEQNGVKVIMTRETDSAIGDTKREDMNRRAEIIRSDVDACISIHMNKFSDRSVKGPMVFYQKGSEAGAELAAYVIRGVCEALEIDRRNANHGDYFVLRAGDAPGVIVECGFLSNSEDERNLQDPVYQQKLAHGICAGVLDYLSGKDGKLEDK